MPHTARSDRSAAVLWLQSRRNNDGREPTSPVLSSHARTQNTAHFLCPSLAFPFAPSLADSPENMGAPASDRGWFKRLISVMKAIIIDIALDFSLLSRRFQGVKLSETQYTQLLVTWDYCRLESTATPCNYPLGSPDEMMQAAGIDDRSYSVRHGGAQRIACLLLRPRHIRVSRPALLRETLLSTMPVANVDTRRRTIES